MATIIVNPLIGSDNLFKNPSFSVIQGAASGALANSTALPTASLGYPGETEWIAAAAGGTPAYAFSPVDENVTFTGAASTTNIYLAQRIESRDIVTLANKLATLTLSAEISNSLLTSVIWEVFRPTTSDDVHGTIVTPTQTLIASGTFTVSSTLARYSATFTLPALATRGLEVRLRVGAQTSGTWVVARLQLEEGSLATNFNCEDFSRELFKCRRTYYATSMYVSPTSTFPISHIFPNRLFASPVTVGGGSGYIQTLINSDGVAHNQAAGATQAMTFSSHIP